MPVIKKLSLEPDLTVRKLASYLEQYKKKWYRFPFELNSPASQNLACRLIGDLGLTQGKQIVEQISKTVGQNTKGKYSITV